MRNAHTSGRVNRTLDSSCARDSAVRWQKDERNLPHGEKNWNEWKVLRRPTADEPSKYQTAGWVGHLRETGTPERDTGASSDSGSRARVDGRRMGGAGGYVKEVKELSTNCVFQKSRGGVRYSTGNIFCVNNTLTSTYPVRWVWDLPGGHLGS